MIFFIEEIKTQYLLLRKQVVIFDSSFKELKIETCKFKSDANLYGAVYQLLLKVEADF